jgi:hypothetical protein
MAGEGALRAGRRLLATYAGAELVFQLTGCNLSSPQTAELNAGARAPTISKWVNLTTAEAIGWVLFLCWLDESLWPALGGGMAGLSMLFKYKYAITSGLKSTAPGTEQYT